MGCMKKMIILISVAITGCVSNSGVIAMGGDTYFVSRQAASGFSGSGTLKGEALAEAGATCSSKGKSVEITKEVNTKPPFIFGNFPKTEITFRCV